MEFTKNRLKNLRYVFQGVYYLVESGPPVIMRVLTSLAWVILGSCFQITINEQIIQLLYIEIVFSVRSLNTAIEKVCDFVHPEHHKTTGVIRDVATGSVAFTIIPTTIILRIIYYLYVLTLFL